MRRLQDKVALVTGASRGIGEAIAMRLAEEGARVVVNARSAKGANTVADKIKDMVGKTVVFAQYAGSMMKVDDEEYFICNDEDIWGVENV